MLGFKNIYNFALVGASGYIAPRHMKAISETDNNLVAAYDPFDSVGIIDSYFPNAHFFTEFERFDRFIDKYHRETDKKIDYVSVVSPNYLHDAHARFALRSGCDVICEKPLVLNPHNIDQLSIIEKETGKKINNILQLRLHPSIIALKKSIEDSVRQNPNKHYDIDLTYITSRGKWYFVSWKGNEAKSGGIATNIGIHFFDMLIWIFGGVKTNTLHVKTEDTNAGMLELERATVRWFLSINAKNIPKTAKEKSQTTYRSIKIENQEIEFSGGFKDLHTASYEEILQGNGFGTDETKSSISLVSDIRNQPVQIPTSDYHPFYKSIA